MLGEPVLGRRGRGRRARGGSADRRPTRRDATTEFDPRPATSTRPSGSTARRRRERRPLPPPSTPTRSTGSRPRAGRPARPRTGSCRRSPGRVDRGAARRRSRPGRTCSCWTSGRGPGDLAAAAAAPGSGRGRASTSRPRWSGGRRSPIPAIPFRVGSFEALPGGAGAFDAVVRQLRRSITSGGRSRACARRGASCGPGGRVALSSWDAPRRNRVLGPLLDAVDAADAPPPPGLPRRADRTSATTTSCGRCSRPPGSSMSASSHLHFEAAVADADTLWRGVLDSAVRIPPLVTEQPADVQARIREAFDELVAVHRPARAGRSRSRSRSR